MLCGRTRWLERVSTSSVRFAGTCVRRRQRRLPGTPQEDPRTHLTAVVVAVHRLHRVCRSECASARSTSPHLTCTCALRVARCLINFSTECLSSSSVSPAPSEACASVMVVMWRWLSVLLLLLLGLILMMLRLRAVANRCGDVDD